MKLKKMLNNIIEEIDPNAMSTANALLFVDKLRSDEELMSSLSQLKMPSDKYKAIMKFASLIGIPESRFEAFMNNMKSTKNNQ